MARSALAQKENHQHSADILDLLNMGRDFSIDHDKKCINILIVDDDEIDFNILKRSMSMMESFDASFYYASGLISAREICSTTEIDIAFVDYCLGVDSGVRAIKEIGGRGGDCAIVMISGMPGNEVPQIALNAGAINHVNKNEITPALLDSVVRSSLYTHEIETKLKNTIVALNDADQAKNNFFSRMSHDLKTPLNAILGYSQAIQAGIYGENKSEKYNEGIDSIYSAGTHLLDVINDLILKASNSHAIEKLEIGTESAQELLEKSASTVSEFARSCGQSVEIEVPENDVLISCNAEIMHQAITNILSNAIKYSDSVGTSILLSVRDLDDVAEIKIKDNGIGMSAADIKLALENHGRVELPAHLAREGTGIGLSIVQEAVKANSGTFLLRSTPGKGTHAIIRLPKAKLN